MPTLPTTLLREDFTNPDLPGWVVLDNGATTWPGGPGVDAGPPQFGTWEVESCWARNVATGPDGLKITATRGGAGWESGRIYHPHAYKPQPGQVMRFEFAATLPKNPDGRYNGYWPAGWMMPSVHLAARQFWPFAGEIDVLEAIGGKAGSSQALHIGHWGENLYADGTTWNEPTGIGTGLAGVNPWDSKEHVYAFEWDRRYTYPEQDMLRFYVDGVLTLGIWEQSFPPLTWAAFAFHDGFYPIFNLAMDGSFPQAVGSTTGPQAQPGGVFAVRYCEITTEGDAIVTGPIDTTGPVVTEPETPPVVVAPLAEADELALEVGRHVVATARLLK